MNIQTIVRTIARKNPPAPKPRAAHGLWVTPAWAVRGLVEQERYNVSDAVRATVRAFNLHPADKAFRGVRAAYYVVRSRPWAEAPGEPQEVEV